MAKSTKSQQTYRYSIEDIKDYAIFMLDPNGLVISWGKGAQQQLGYKEKDVIGKHFSIFFTKDDVDEGSPKIALIAARKKGKQLSQRQYICKNGKKFWGSTVLTEITDKLSNQQGFSVIIRDITEQRRVQGSSIHQSTHDYLTGLPNRRFLEEDLKNAIHSTKDGLSLAVLFLDFNNFKRANEHGHAYGDIILTSIAEKLRASTRREDMVARLGGDEFIILLKDVKNVADIEKISNKTLKIFRKPMKIKENVYHITVSIGISLFPRDGKTVSDLLHFSDMALYQAKKEGGNRFKFYAK